MAHLQAFLRIHIVLHRCGHERSRRSRALHFAKVGCGQPGGRSSSILAARFLRRGGFFYEAHVSAKRPPPQAQARVPCTHGDAGGPALGVGAEELGERVLPGLNRSHRSSSSLHTSLSGCRFEENSLRWGASEWPGLYARRQGVSRQTAAMTRTYDAALRRTAARSRGQT